MYCLTTFDLTAMIQCGRELRSIGKESRSLEEAAQKIVGFLHENLTLHPHPRADRASILTRLFITQHYHELNDEQKTAARNRLEDGLPEKDFNCLTLIASRGEEPSWNDPAKSIHHKAIPLVNAAQVNKLPMVASLLKQLGVEIDEIVYPKTEILLDPDHRQSYGIFLVPEALGSPAIPRQEDFVKPYGVISVVGFGGRLVPGRLFSIILFTRCKLGWEQADLLRALALSTRVALLSLLPIQTGSVSG